MLYHCRNSAEKFRCFYNNASFVSVSCSELGSVVNMGSDFLTFCYFECFVWMLHSIVSVANHMLSMKYQTKDFCQSYESNVYPRILIGKFNGYLLTWTNPWGLFRNKSILATLIALERGALVVVKPTLCLCGTGIFMCVALV